jgi:hypothetical protein
MGHLPFTGSIARSGIQIVPDRKTVITETDHCDASHVKNFLRTVVSLHSIMHRWSSVNEEITYGFPALL